MKKKILIVGFGNEFCGDDALGPLVVKLLQQYMSGELRVESLKTKLLTPNSQLLTVVDLQIARHLDFTWAEVLANYQYLIFVDASAHRGYPLVKVKKLSRPLNPAYGGTGRPFTSHHISIDHLLKITRELYGKNPSAYLVAVRGENFDFGKELSSRGRQAAGRAVKKILSLIKDLAPAT